MHTVCTVLYVSTCILITYVDFYNCKMLLMAGLEIRSSAFWANRTFFAYGRSFVKSHRSNSLTVTIFKKATGGICSRRSLKKSDWAKSDGSDLLLGIKRGESCEKLLEHMKNTVFYSESLVFWERFAQITRESLMSLFLKEIKSDSLMVTLL